MEVCPTEIIHASAERIWQLLTDPRELTPWTRTKLLRGAARPMQAGDLLVLRAGVMRVSFEVLDAAPAQYLRLCIGLPFGIVNHEQVQITPAGGSTCRVTFT